MDHISDRGPGKARTNLELSHSSKWGSLDTIARLDEKWQPRRHRRRWHNERYRLSLVLRKNLQAGTSLVDVGCGTGYYVPDYLQRISPEKIHLADGAPNMLEHCRRLFPKIPSSNFHQTSIYELPFSDGQFDAVVNCDVLMHIPQYQKALGELYRVCNPHGGRLYLRVNLVDGETDGALPDPKNPDPDYVYWIAYGRDEFRRTVEDLNPGSITILDHICRKSHQLSHRKVIGHAAIVVLTRGENSHPLRTGSRLTHLLGKPLGAWT